MQLVEISDSVHEADPFFSGARKPSLEKKQRLNRAAFDEFDYDILVFGSLDWAFKPKQ
jgi:hypothetical protein